ncbi:MAG: 4Fe-4S binding protein [Acidiferrobacteraceae bacterium]
MSTVSGKSCLAEFGSTLRRHPSAIAGFQWAMIALYLALLALPALPPLLISRTITHARLDWFVRFAFWGLWWPLLIVSILLAGRVWCGLLCPEGTLTEVASRFGLGHGAPTWMKWGGWPFVAFTVTAICGELMNVHGSARTTVLLFGASTVLAVVVGLIYGRGKRVWCRYLCPINGIFIVLARLSPVYFRVNQEAWVNAPRGTRSSLRNAVNCAPLIDIRRMTGASQCHLCGRCSDHRGAVTLAARSPNQEILSLTERELSRWDIGLLVYGLLGISVGAFQWMVSPWYVLLRHHVGIWAGHAAAAWSLQAPGAGVLKIVCLVLYIGGTAAILGSWVLLWLRLAQRFLMRSGSLTRLAYTLTPLAGASMLLGSGILLINVLRIPLTDFGWIGIVRDVLLAGGVIWSCVLAVRLTQNGENIPRWRRRLGCTAIMASASIVAISWVVLI